LRYIIILVGERCYYVEDYKKNFLDLDEIDRIQREIEQNLHAVPQSDKKTFDYDKTPEVSKESHEYLSSDQDVEPEFESDVDISQNSLNNQVSELNVLSSDFLNSDILSQETLNTEESGNEVFRGEGRRHDKKGFRRKVAVLIAVCTLGTGTLGLGIGAGYPLVANRVSSSINSENHGNYIDVPEMLSSGAEIISDVTDVLTEANLQTYSETVVVESLSDVVRVASPSVVSIRTVFDSSSNFFRLPYNESSSGSGVIFYEDATDVFIATNHHVISGASAVWVHIEYNEGSEDIQASFVGSNPEYDLAVISISKDDILRAGVAAVSIATFGDSDEMLVGDFVLAIGNAMGEGIIVTAGILSAVDREISVSQNTTLTVIQTDAAINPGNSGGPLINVFGEVIGINTARPSRADVEGMGYSISSNIARPILDEILNRTPRPFLGIRGSDISRELADMYDLPTSLGVLVEEVIPDSGAQRAGIRRTDIITGFNETPIFSMRELTEEIQNHQVGDEVVVKLVREGRLYEIEVVLSEYKIDNF